MNKRLCLPLLATLAIALTACTSKKVTPEEYSGFLHDYSQLSEKDSPSGQTVLSWVSPTLNMQHYTRVYIEPSQFYPQLQPTRRDPQTMRAAVTRYYDGALRRELGKTLKVVSIPGPHTLIVRPAITSVSARTQSLRFYEWLPVTLLAAGVSTATGIRDQDSEITTEVAFVDATSHEVVAQVVRKGTGLALDNDQQVMRVDDLKAVLDGWALELRQAYSAAVN